MVLLTGVALASLFLVRLPEPLLIVSETALAAMAAAAVILASWAVGSGLIAACARGTSGTKPALRVGETFLIGFPAFGTLVGIVAWVSVAPVPALTIILAFGGVLLGWKQRATFRFPRSWPLAAFAIIPAVVLAAVEAIAPVVSADELIYKLAVPHAYELYGRMVEQPLNSNSYLAMSFNLGDLPALMLGGAIAAKIVHFGLYLAALAAIRRVGLRLSAAAGWWIVAVVAYTPALMVTSGWAHSEWGVLGLLAVSFDRYQEWAETRVPGELIASFAAAGGAVSAKYTALPWLAPFFLIFFWRHRKDRRAIVIASLVLLLTGSFFYLRNTVWTGSPFAPLLLPDAPSIQNYRSGYELSGWVDLVRGKDIADPSITDESLGILLPLCFLASAFALRRRDRPARDLLLIGGAQMIVLLTIAPGSRNMLNGIVAFALPGAAVIAESWVVSRRSIRVIAAATAMLAAGAQSTIAVNTLADVIPYLSGHEGEAGYFSRTRTFTGAYGWIARSTPADARVLLLGETRTLYMPRRFVSGGNLDGPRVAHWLARFTTADAMAGELRRDAVTHVLFHAPWYRVQSPGMQPFSMLEGELGLSVSPATHALLGELFRKHTVLRYRDREYLIFELKPQPRLSRRYPAIR